MEIKINVDPNNKDEIIINVQSLTSDIEALYEKITSLIDNKSCIRGFDREEEYIIDLNEILFIETEAEKVFAHTKVKSYLIKSRLYELEESLPYNFIRISKSTIINILKIHSIDRSLKSTSLISFNDSYKQVYASRRYYKNLKDRIEERSIK